MKATPGKQQDHLFFLASDNVFIYVNRPYRIQADMIETRNFVPGALMIHCFHELNKSGFDCYNFLRLPNGEMLMPLFDPELRNSSALESPFLKDDDDEKKDDDWDEEDDEDWDEEDDDEDWDEDEDEDEDWDEDEDEDWEDDEEEWDDEDDESSDEEE